MLRTTTTGHRTLHQTDERAGNEYQKAEGNTSLQEKGKKERIQRAQEKGGGMGAANGATWLTMHERGEVLL